MNRVVEPALRRVLVIDDNEAIHGDFRKIFGASQKGAALSEAEVGLFGKQGERPATPEFLIDSAFHGQEGLALVQQAREQQCPYAMAFVDVRMPPGWDGIETTVRIWQHDPDIQIVICTAYSDYSWSEMLAKLGNSDRLVILKKPFDTIEVLQLASALSEKWRLARQSRSILEDLEHRVAERTRELVKAGERLQASETQYRLLFDSNPHPMWVCDLETLQFLTVNGAAVEHYGYTESQFLAMTIRDIRPPEDIVPLENAVNELRERGTNFGAWRHLKQDGSLIDVEISGDDIMFNGRSARLVLAHDVTARNLAETRVKRLNRVYAVLSQINTLIVRVRNREDLFSEACRISIKEGGFSAAMLGVVDPSATKVVQVASAGRDQEILAAVNATLSLSVSDSLHMVARAVRTKVAIVFNDSQVDPDIPNDNRYSAFGVRSMAALPLMVAGEAIGALVLYSGEAGFFHEDEMQLLTELTGDISFAMDHIDKQERLEYLAYYDAVTGLANRNLFLERVAQYLRSAAANEQQSALILIDLERFKNINDSLGRSAGDALLRQVAQWLTDHFGDANLVARVGSDHFGVVLPAVRNEGDVARRLGKAVTAFLARQFLLVDAPLRIAAKFGVALFPDDGENAEMLFKNAEAALKKAKSSGERSLFHTQKMTESVASRLSLESRLRQALDNEEFVLHYQPKVNLQTGKVTSAEALIRWNDPRTGLVPPEHFIPILEETGLIYDVGRWALRKAIADYLHWRAAGFAAVPIAVNVSPLQLRNRDLVGEIERNISIDAHAAAGLELEITESMIMDDVQRSIASLHAIRAMGITVAIDDFGTGFSSLGYLSKLPVDTLKIDRSFVTGMTASPDGLSLMSAMIQLAHSLKLKVVAEGVETEEQLRLLRLLKCDEMQGYLFSRPVPCETFVARFLATSE